MWKIFIFLTITILGQAHSKGLICDEVEDLNELKEQILRSTAIDEELGKFWFSDKISLLYEIILQWLFWNLSYKCTWLQKLLIKCLMQHYGNLSINQNCKYKSLQIKKRKQRHSILNGNKTDFSKAAVSNTVATSYVWLLVI